MARGHVWSGPVWTVTIKFVGRSLKIPSFKLRRVSPVKRTFMFGWSLAGISTKTVTVTGVRANVISFSLSQCNVMFSDISRHQVKRQAGLQLRGAERHEVAAQASKSTPSIVYNKVQIYISYSNSKSYDILFSNLEIPIGHNWRARTGPQWEPSQ